MRTITDEQRAVRNREIYRLALAGVSYERLGGVASLSKQRVWDIAHEYARQHGLLLPSGDLEDYTKPA